MERSFNIQNVTGVPNDDCISFYLKVASILSNNRIGHDYIIKIQNNFEYGFEINRSPGDRMSFLKVHKCSSDIFDELYRFLTKNEGKIPGGWGVFRLSINNTGDVNLEFGSLIIISPNHK